MSDEGKEGTNPELLALMVESREREFQVKEKELELEREKNQAAKEEGQRQYDFAVKSLEAMERDRESDRSHFCTIAEKSKTILLVLIICLFAFLITAIWKDKDAMIIELVKIIIYGGAGTAGGFAWGWHKKQKSED